MKVTRAPTRCPRRSASSSSSRISGAAAGRARAISSAARRTSSRSVVSNSTPATRSAITAADNADRKNRAWKPGRYGTALIASRMRIDQLVAELLDRHQPFGQRRQFLAQAPYVDVDGAGAAGVAIAPDVGEEH